MYSFGCFPGVWLLYAILHTITRPHPDTRLLYLPLHTFSPYSEPPTTWRPSHWFCQLQQTSALVYKYYVLRSLLILYIQPLKMEPIKGSETSAYNNQTPGKHPKEYIIDSKHGESLKPRMLWHVEVMFKQFNNWLNITSTCHNMFIVSNTQQPKKFTHKFYYRMLILIELYFNNFNYCGNFRPFTCFSVMIPETV